MDGYRHSRTDLFFTHIRLVCLARVLLPIALATVFVLALIPPTQVPFAATFGDKILHASAFFVLAALLDTAQPQQKFRYKLLWLAAIGLGIEIAQSFSILRTFALDDLIADIVGSCLYAASTPLLKRLPIIRLRWQTGEYQEI